MSCMNKVDFMWMGVPTRGKMVAMPSDLDRVMILTQPLILSVAQGRFQNKYPAQLR